MPDGLPCQHMAAHSPRMPTRAEELRALMDAESSEEKACQPFLHDIVQHLVPWRVPLESILVKGREESSRPGDSDFCVSVEVDNGAVGRRYAYVWEVKAPQKFLFVRDAAANRLRPTDQLYSAENQLINYVAELGRSQNFRDKFLLTGTLDEVRVGGIIIGRRDRMVKGAKHADAALQGLARNAFSTREAFLWGPAGIQVCTWDWVYERLLDEETLVRKASHIHAERSMTPVSMFAFAQELLASRDEVSFRAAVVTAFSAVELKVMPGGWSGRGKSVANIIRQTVRAAGREDLDVLFEQLYSIRNRCVHVFNERVTEAEVAFSIRAAITLCSDWDDLLGDVQS